MDLHLNERVNISRGWSMKKLLPGLFRRKWEAHARLRKAVGKIHEITPDAFDTLLNSGDSGAYTPRGLFWLERDGEFVGVNNSNGDAWTESFSTKRHCIQWLLGEIDVEGVPIHKQSPWSIAWLDADEKFLLLDCPKKSIKGHLHKLLDEGVHMEQIYVFGPERLWPQKDIVSFDSPAAVGDVIYRFDMARNIFGNWNCSFSPVGKIADGNSVAIITSSSDPNLTFLYRDHVNVLYSADEQHIWGYASDFRYVEKLFAQSRACIHAGTLPDAIRTPALSA